jgi:hypothetical protein
MRVMARSQAEPDPGRRADLEREASAMLTKLGVVWTPDLLAPTTTDDEDPAMLEDRAATV